MIGPIYLCRELRHVPPLATTPYRVHVHALMHMSMCSAHGHVDGHASHAQSTRTCIPIMHTNMRMHMGMGMPTGA